MAACTKNLRPPRRRVENGKREGNGKKRTLKKERKLRPASPSEKKRSGEIAKKTEV